MLCQHHDHRRRRLAALDRRDPGRRQTAARDAAALTAGMEKLWTCNVLLLDLIAAFAVMATAIGSAIAAWFGPF